MLPNCHSTPMPSLLPLLWPPLSVPPTLWSEHIAQEPFPHRHESQPHTVPNASWLLLPTASIPHRATAYIERLLPHSTVLPVLPHSGWLLSHPYPHRPPEWQAYIPEKPSHRPVHALPAVTELSPIPPCVLRHPYIPAPQAFPPLASVFSVHMHFLSLRFLAVLLFSRLSGLLPTLFLSHCLPPVPPFSLFSIFQCILLPVPPPVLPSSRLISYSSPVSKPPWPSQDRLHLPILPIPKRQTLWPLTF